MKIRNINMTDEEIRINYNGYILTISPGAKNSLRITGIKAIGFENTGATYFTPTKSANYILNE